MFKKITGILLAVLMMSTICCQAVELSYSVVVSNDNFDSYTVNNALPCGTGEKWEKSVASPGWNTTVVKPSRRGPQYLEIEKPNATVEADSYSLTTPKLGAGAVLTGDVDVSFKIYIPSLGTAPSGEAYNPREEDYAVSIVAVNGAENDLLDDGFKLWTHHTGDVPKVSVGQTFYELGWNTWYGIRMVFDSDTQTVSYYINNDTDTPTASQSITESYNISYIGFCLDKSLPEIKFGIDDFYMEHSNTEVIDEASMTISYVPVYNGETRTLTIDGTARPYFDQNAQAAVYSMTDSTTPLVSAEVATTEGGAFTINMDVPSEVSGRVLLDVSSDYLPAGAAGRKMEILIYNGALDAEISSNYASYVENKDSAIVMLNTYLPQIVTRPEWFAYLENKDFYTEYFMVNAEKNILYSSAAELGEAFDKAAVILEINNASASDKVGMLDDKGFVDLSALEEAELTEFNRVWEANELTEDFVCEDDIKARIDEVMSVALVNCAKRSEISEIVKTYQSTFGLTDEEVSAEGLDFDIVCAPLFNQGYIYPSEIEAALKASIEEQLEQNKSASSKDDDSGSSNRGGGGGGGGSRVSVSTTIIESKPELAPETVPEEEIASDGKQDSQDGKPTGSTQFGDIENHWAKEAILTLVEENIINGYEDNTFRPGNYVSRAEYIAMAVRLLKLETADSSFSDVKAEAWYSGVIGAAEKAGIIKGSDNCFFPENTITRQDAAVILYRMLGEPEADKEEIVFADADSIAAYAEKAVKVLSSMGIINGYNGSFEPQREISRAETAKILYSAADALKSR